MNCWPGTCSFPIFVLASSQHFSSTVSTFTGKPYSLGSIEILPSSKHTITFPQTKNNEHTAEFSKHRHALAESQVTSLTAAAMQWNPYGCRSLALRTSAHCDATLFAKQEVYYWCYHLYYLHIQRQSFWKKAQLKKCMQHFPAILRIS